MIRPTLVRQAERLVNRNPLLYGPGPVARHASGIGAMVRRRTYDQISDHIFRSHNICRTLSRDLLSAPGREWLLG